MDKVGEKKMSEVEKMYRNSGVEKHKKAMLDIETGKDVLTLDSFYPEFTAEKQLRIMELLVRKGMLLFTFSTQGNYKVSGFCRGSSYCSDIKEAFANYINNLWQSLTEEERKQIRGILE